MYTLDDDKHSDMFAKSALHAYRKKSDIKYQVSAKRLGRNICHALPNDVNDRLHGTTFLAFLVRFSFVSHSVKALFTMLCHALSFSSRFSFQSVGKLSVRSTYGIDPKKAPQKLVNVSFGIPASISGSCL